VESSRCDTSQAVGAQGRLGVLRARDGALSDDERAFVAAADV
jgi:hypothetical protein